MEAQVHGSKMLGAYRVGECQHEGRKGRVSSSAPLERLLIHLSLCVGMNVLISFRWEEKGTSPMRLNKSF